MNTYSNKYVYLGPSPDERPNQS